jgi:hypothetical protein
LLPPAASAFCGGLLNTSEFLQAAIDDLSPSKVETNEAARTPRSPANKDSINAAKSRLDSQIAGWRRVKREGDTRQDPSTM